MSSDVKKSYQESMTDLADKYRAITGKEPVTSEEVGQWAIDNGEWDVPREAKLKRFKGDFSDAMRKATRVDAQGREVRKEAASRYAELYVDDDGNERSVQKWLWVDAQEASAEHMRSSFMLRHNSIGSDVKALARDVASANDNNPNLAECPIQMSFDFTEYAVDDEPTEDGEFNPPSQPR